MLEHPAESINNLLILLGFQQQERKMEKNFKQCIVKKNHEYFSVFIPTSLAVVGDIITLVTKGEVEIMAAFPIFNLEERQLRV
jgi:hypothetical protein